MTTSEPSPSNRDRLDWQLLQDTPIVLYWRPSLFAEDLAALELLGYRSFRFDAGGWASTAEFHADVARRLRFPQYYGHNLDAFNDCLGDLPLEGEGTVLAFQRFDLFARLDPRHGHAVLDIIASTSRRLLLAGYRLLALIQSDDAELRFEPVGATPVLWNAKEWLQASRGRGAPPN